MLELDTVDWTGLFMTIGIARKDFGPKVWKFRTETSKMKNINSRSFLS